MIQAAKIAKRLDTKFPDSLIRRIVRCVHDEGRSDAVRNPIGVPSMLIPWTTDARLDRFPWVTAGLIAVNTVAFFVVGFGSIDGVVAWSVEYGTGLHPLQWLTSIFMHAGALHLVGNMLFLWVFGMVVEGKLGWWRFLIAYLLLGISETAAEQVMTFWFGAGRAVGASGVIFSLLGMALVWAPETEVECHWVVGLFGMFFRWAEVQISILWMAIFYIGLNAFAAWRNGFQSNAAAAHTLGALFGVALGFALLKWRWVECEGWDLITVMTGRYLNEHAARRRSRKPEVPDLPGGGAEGARLEAEFAEPRPTAGDPPLTRVVHPARRDCEQALESSVGQLSEPELIRHADELCRHGFQNEAVPLLEEYLQRFKQRADLVRLKLAELAIKVQRRPQYGLRVLSHLPANPLKPRYQKHRLALTETAQAMIADGILELQDRAW